MVCTVKICDQGQKCVFLRLVVSMIPWMTARYPTALKIMLIICFLWVMTPLFQERKDFSGESRDERVFSAGAKVIFTYVCTL